MPAGESIFLFESVPATVIVSLLSVVLGLFVGDALYGLARRLTSGEPVLSTTVRCGSCGYAIPLSERMPVLSWVRRGVCPHCGNPVSLALPACQVLAALMITSIVLRYGISVQTFEIVAFCCVLMTICLTAVTDYSIRNECVILAVGIRIIYVAWLLVSGGDALTIGLASLVGACGLGLPLLAAVFLANAMLSRDMTGFGTVKLASLVGLYLGWQQGLMAMGIALFIGAAVWIVSPSKLVAVEVVGGPGREEQPKDGQAEPMPRGLPPTREEDIAEPMRLIPFAPSIALGCWIVLLVGVAVGAWNAPII